MALGRAADGQWLARGRCIRGLMARQATPALRADVSVGKQGNERPCGQHSTRLSHAGLTLHPTAQHLTRHGNAMLLTCCAALTQ